MPTQPQVRLNRRAVSAILKSDAAAALADDAAGRIAAAITGVDAEDIQVSSYTTDRRAASVSIPTWAQARDGALTRAASRVGLEVRRK